ncbi:hypothetical protein VitviT2T_015428 [Vitis vinifera]|uniref:Uncharacterized protein n=2 Tax=Vitis vinifera TaxID=29760 RepID=F6HLS2_VITVI|nr:hypothetical protein VitviT2T_015428 [Vitis vinifera]
MVAQCLGAICDVGFVKAFMKSFYNSLGGGANSVVVYYSKDTALGVEITLSCSCTLFAQPLTLREASETPMSLFWLHCPLGLLSSWTIMPTNHNQLSSTVNPFLVHFLPPSHKHAWPPS